MSIPARPIPGGTALVQVWPLIVGIVVAIIVVVGLFATTMQGSGAPAGATTPTYSRASNASDRVAAGTPGGPWDLVVAAGLSLAASGTATVNGTIGTGCTYAPINGSPIPLSFYIPRGSAGVASGGSPWWGMVYFQPSSQNVLLVDVTNGSAHAVLVASGSCTSRFANYTAIPSGVVDSSTAASAVWNAGGATFLSDHSGVAFNLFFVLLGGGKNCVVTSGPCWLAEYTPCNPVTQSGPSGEQPIFGAIVDATTGDIPFPFPAVSESTCSSSGGLGFSSMGL